MRTHSPQLCALAGTGFMLAGIACVGSAPAAAARPRTITGYARIEPACPQPKPGQASCFALVRHEVPSSQAGEPGVRPFAVRAGAASTGPAGGLTPAQLASVYGYDPNARPAPEQTVAIVDAFDDPKIEADLAEFDGQYGLAACTAANGCFKKVGQTGSAALPAADEMGWSVETSLDVEAVHATCTSCKILLVEADDPEFTSLAEATNTAVALGATVISNSYGGAEARVPAVEAAYNHPGVVIAAATGDLGWDSWTAFNEEIAPPVPPRPNLPATLPTVVSVGGTSLTLGSGERRSSETVWNGNGPLDDGAFPEGASGGGCSTIYAAQAWQLEAPGYAAAGCAGRRLNADVAAVADPLTGFDIFDSFDCGASCEQFRRGESWLTIGGTSLATPLISGMYALAGGSDGVNYPALTLYGHLKDASLFDVSEGGNGYCDDDGGACGVNAEVAEMAIEFPVLRGVKLDCEGTTACNASAGFDGPSGVGAPASLSLFRPLLPTAAIASPPVAVAGVPLGFSSAGSSDPYPGGLSGAAYSWSFGDGATASGPTPSHSFAAPGSYQVTLTVTDRYGLTSAPQSAALTVGGEPAHGGAESVGLAGPSVGVAGFKVSPGPIARLAGSSLQAAGNGTFSVKVACPAGEISCNGTVTVQTLVAVAASGRARVLTLGSGSFSIAGGRIVSVRLHLTRNGRTLLARRHSLRVLVRIVARDPAGLSHTTKATASLRAARKRG